MGWEISHTRFSEQDFALFKKCLNEDTAKLQQLFAQQNFKCPDSVGGFELEAWIVDKDAKVLPKNDELLKLLDHEEFVPELSKFNFEINVQPEKLSEKALSTFESRLLSNWQYCVNTADEINANTMMIGIHPCVDIEHLNVRNMSSLKRYQALNEQVLGMRSNRPLLIDIKGRKNLQLKHSDLMLEALTTSFQIHLKVSQKHSVRAYNASQFISAALVAVSANSPYVFGVDLWDESRIPVFEQAVDTGEESPKRVTFGDDYVNDSLFELFTNNLNDYPILIPDNQIEGADGFEHLRLHNGTVWRWNRPLLGFNDDGSNHLRIENRVAPAGPTVKDMIANAALYWGLVEAYTHDESLNSLLLPFEYARYNFYEAARYSLDAELIWFGDKKVRADKLVLNTLLPQAMVGLLKLGIDSQDANNYLEIIRSRLAYRQNGAQWQRKWVEKYGKNFSKLAKIYLENQNSQQAVHEWDI